MRGRKPIPKSGTLATTPLAALPRCPDHLNNVARREWRRLATPLFEAGILSLGDRAALAAYCVAYARWVEAEVRLQETPLLLKSPNGYPQQSPWLTIANKQLDLMGRYMGELGLTPVARTRLGVSSGDGSAAATTIEFVTIYTDEDGNRVEKPLEQRRSDQCQTPGEADYKISWKS